ncbi:hypothetical protein R6Q59_022038 [Mikania micrantha]|uniref:Dof zinc finger protein n=1 Tax=Mikania micrantha TaxID=192012 RepID=A0A5N6MWP1_9ASTR|nr:hypothetical protein E3N88_27031 [Mikania micrantha]
MKPMKEILLPNTTNSTSNHNNNLSKSSSFERRVRSQKAAAVNCPRCDSTNTKFCYYNNYSLSQPRYFCKTCRRYWTEGGTLRNIPVGGGSRKNKRLSSSSSSSCSSSYSSVGGGSKKFSYLVVPSASTTVPSQILHDQYGHDLNLGFPSIHSFKNVSGFLQEPNFDATKDPNSSALELLNGITTRGVTNSFMPIMIPDPNSVYTNPAGQLRIPLPEFKIPSLSSSLDGIGNDDGGAYGNNLHERNSGRLLFPFEELKTDTSTTHDDDQGGQSKDQNCDSNGFWNGMMGGGSW